MWEALIGAGCAVVLAGIVWLVRKGQSKPPTASQGPAWMKQDGLSTTIQTGSGDLSQVKDLLAGIQKLTGQNITIDTEVVTHNVVVDGLEDLIRSGRKDEAVKKLQDEAGLNEAAAKQVVEQLASVFGG